MINLVPPEQKKEYRAARVNTVLRRYLVTTVFALTSILIVFGLSFYTNYMNHLAYGQQLAQSKAELEALKDVRAKVKEYNKNIDQAKMIFRQQVSLSEVVAIISGTLPAGVVLDSVALDAQQLNEPLLVVAQVDSFEKAGVLKLNFEKSGVFEAVDLKDVTDNSIGSEEGQALAYPFTANLEVTLAEDLGEDESSTGKKEASP